MRKLYETCSILYLKSVQEKPYISSKRDFYYTQKESFFSHHRFPQFLFAHSMRRALYSTKRVLCSLEKAPDLIRTRLLLHTKRVFLQLPLFSWSSNRSLLSTMKCTIYQMSPIPYQKSPVLTQKSPIFNPKRLLFHQMRPLLQSPPLS